MAPLLSVIADLRRATLDAERIDHLAAFLDTAPVWLAEGEACELPFSGDARTAYNRARQIFAGDPIDVNLVDQEPRRKRVLLADMDSTMIAVECVDELAEAVGVRERVAAITARAMNGEIDFAEALAERVALLKGLPEAELQRVFDQRVALNPGAAALIRTHKAQGGHSALVSGGFTFFTERVAAACGFDEHVANELAIEDGALTGAVVPPIRDKTTKVETLERLLREHDATRADVVALGDGANDVPMLERAGMGVAYHAHAAVREAVPLRIDYADLRAVLFLQGYRADEVAAV